MTAIANLPQLECSSTNHCRNSTTELEEVINKISIFAIELLNRRGKEHQLNQAINKQRIGYKKESENLFNEANDLNYLMFTLFVFYLDNKYNNLYTVCDTNKCDDVDALNSLLDKYKFSEVLKCLQCKDYEYTKLKAFIEKDLGIKLSINPNQISTGIGYMCITDIDVPNYTCSCNYNVFTVK